jgi:transposase
VAGICRQIKLIEVIDESLPTVSNRKVSCGEATQAMVLNALGLSGRALYLMPEYMQNKPVDLLIREGLVAEDFNDDTLGRALDELQQAGVTELFAQVAQSAVTVFDIETDYAHLDTSSFSLQGSYESVVAQRAVDAYEAVEIKQGYSKENRPDLKQVVVTLITSQASALPLWLEVLDGNSSDKVSFRESVQAYVGQLEGETPPWFIMDSAGYTQENLAGLAHFATDNLSMCCRCPSCTDLVMSTAAVAPAPSADRSGQAVCQTRPSGQRCRCPDCGLADHR